MPWKELGGVLAMIVLLLLLYVGAYFAMMERKEWGYGVVHPVVEYRFGGEWSHWFFGPMHEIDRRLRPDSWDNEVRLSVRIEDLVRP